jgi:DHA1 family multidrug resistance protein-like MFS transporter
MLEILREAPLGQAIRYISGNKLLQYPEELLSFQLPFQYLYQLEENEKLGARDQDSSISDGAVFELARGNDTVGFEPRRPAEDDLENLGQVRSIASIRAAPYTNERIRAEREFDLQRSRSIPIIPQKTNDGVVLVDWYTTDDPANPQNWSSFKKGFIVFILCFYTWTVYCDGPIYATASDGIVQRFGVSPIAASLGLGLYILAYGIGDLLFSPLSEIPLIGRNSIYYLTFIVFWALFFAPVVVNNFGGLLALRFCLGKWGSDNRRPVFPDIHSVRVVLVGLLCVGWPCIWSIDR